MNLFLNKISRFAWPKIQKTSHDKKDAFFANVVGNSCVLQGNGDD